MSRQGLEVQDAAAEIKLRAERRAGEMLAEMDLRGGDRRSESKFHDGTLKVLGIDKKQSFRWQLLAYLNEIAFQEYIDETLADGKELTTSGALKLAAKQKAEDRRLRQPSHRSADARPNRARCGTGGPSLGRGRPAQYR